MRSKHQFVITSLLLFVCLSVTAQPLQVQTDHYNGFYHRGEAVTFRVTGTAGVAEYLVSKDGLGTLSSGTVALTDKNAEIQAKLDEPGVIRCAVTMKSPASSQPARAVAGAAIDPHLIRPSLPPPDDFDAYWNAQKKLLADEPMKPVLTEVKSPDPSIDTFDVQINCPGGAPVSGYLAIPKNAKPGAMPALLYPHFAGVWTSILPHAVHGAQLGTIAFDFNAHGIPNGKPDPFYADLNKNSLANYQLRGITEGRDQVYFRGMYLRLMRAIDYLTTRPEWDGKILMVQGLSQGGGQALVAAGLDQRVSLCLSVVPGMCDMTGFKADRVNGWPQLVPKDANGAYDEKAAQTARYFDAMNFATRIKANTYVFVGLIDDTCPTTTVYAAFNAIPGDNKQILPQPLMGHEFPVPLQEQCDQLVREHIAGRHWR